MIGTGHSTKRLADLAGLQERHDGELADVEPALADHRLEALVGDRRSAEIKRQQLRPDRARPQGLGVLIFGEVDLQRERAGVSVGGHGGSPCCSDQGDIGVLRAYRPYASLPSRGHVAAALQRHAGWNGWGFGMFQPANAVLGPALVALVASAAGETVLAQGGTPSGGASTSLDAAISFAQATGTHIATWLVDGYQRRPAVMIGLAGILLVPALALAGLIVAWLTRQPAAAATARDILLPPRDVWLEIEGQTAIKRPLSRPLVQIGRQDDNDICLDDETVDRYHAVIERTPDDAFVISDVSGPDSQGVKVNGERRRRAVLVAGDTIEVGAARLRVAFVA